AQPGPSGAPVDQEPAQLGCLRRGGDDRDTADDLAVALGNPDSLTVGSGTHELGERAGDVCLEGVVEAILPRVTTGVQVDKGAHIAGSQGRPERDGSVGGASGLHYELSFVAYL